MAICASCGTNNVDGTKFCVQCGAALAPSPGAWRTPTEELNAPAGGGQQTAPPTQPYNAPTPNVTFPTPPPPPVIYGTSAHGRRLRRGDDALRRMGRPRHRR